MRAPRHTAAHAIRLRQKLSKPEALLWLRLRERLPGRPTFRRQHAMGPYILDFYCSKARLAIEIDGMNHDMADRPQRDLRRDAWLKEHAVTVLRLSAAEVLRDVDETADGIICLAADLSSRAARDGDSLARGK